MFEICFDTFISRIWGHFSSMLGSCCFIRCIASALGRIIRWQIWLNTYLISLSLISLTLAQFPSCRVVWRYITHWLIKKYKTLTTIHRHNNHIIRRARWSIDIILSIKRVDTHWYRHIFKERKRKERKGRKGKERKGNNNNNNSFIIMHLIYSLSYT